MLPVRSFSGVSISIFITSNCSSSFIFALGLLNLRGSDFEYLPVFFAYAIITENEARLYLMKQDRAKTNKIDNHFQTEHIDIITSEYNDTLAGINLVVSKF